MRPHNPRAEHDEPRDLSFFVLVALLGIAAAGLAFLGGVVRDVFR